MALNQLQKQTVIRGMAVAKTVLEDLKPEVDELNIIYDSQGGAKSTITQNALDAEPGFSGLTKAQLDDGMYAITNGLKTAIDNAIAQLAQLAARA